MEIKDWSKVRVIKSIEEVAKIPRYKFLATLVCKTMDSGTFCHPTILVSAKDEDDAREIIHGLKPGENIGRIKKVDY